MSGTSPGSSKDGIRDGAAPTGRSRPAQRKVHLPAGSTRPQVVRPPAPKRPWWRQGRFWFAVVVIEVLGAWGLSIAFATSTTEISLEGADLGSFCTVIRENREASPASSDAAGMPAELTRQAAVYRRLEPVAPNDLRPDLDKLANETDKLAAFATDALARASGGDSFGPTTEIGREQETVAARVKDESARLDVAALKGCGIDLQAAPPTPTTPVPSASVTPAPPVGPVVPTSAPAPGTTATP